MSLVITDSDLKIGMPRRSDYTVANTGSKTVYIVLDITTTGFAGTSSELDAMADITLLATESVLVVSANRDILAVCATGESSTLRSLAGEILSDFSGDGTIAPGVVTAKTASYSVLAADNNVSFTNTGASAAIVFTLPSSGAGSFTFIVVEDFSLTITAQGSDIIRVGTVVTGAAGSIVSTVVGSVITLQKIDTEWTSFSVVEGW